MIGSATREAPGAGAAYETREQREARERRQEGATGIEAPTDGLWRYGRWQLRDFVVQKASVLMLVAVLLMYPIVAGTLEVSPSLEQFAREARRYWIYAMFGVLAPLGTILGTRGIVSEDRQQGFHRFLFAKPVKLARYYAQQAGIAFVGLMAVLAVVGLLYAGTISGFAVVPAFVPAAVCFVLFGGVTFFFSTVTRRDLIWTMGTIAASAWTRFLVHERGWSILRPLEAVLLPLQSFANMVRDWMMLVEGSGTVGGALASTMWPLAYGAAAFAAGLWVLKKRSVIR